MTAALSCYGLEGGETVGIVNEGRGITVLNPQMEFCSVSRWNNLVGFLSLYTVMSFSFLVPNSLPQVILYLFWRLFFASRVWIILQWRLESVRKNGRRKRRMKCNIFVRIQTDFQTGCLFSVCFVHTVYLRRALDWEWTSAVLTVHLSYLIVCRIVSFCVCAVLASAVVFKTY